MPGHALFCQLGVLLSHILAGMTHLYCSSPHSNVIPIPTLREIFLNYISKAASLLQYLPAPGQWGMLGLCYGPCHFGQPPAVPLLMKQQIQGAKGICTLRSCVSSSRSCPSYLGPCTSFLRGPQTHFQSLWASASGLSSHGWSGLPVLTPLILRGTTGKLFAESMSESWT